MASGDFFMKGKPLGEAEKAQNTKIACHVETRRQDCGRDGEIDSSRFQMLVVGRDLCFCGQRNYLVYSDMLMCVAGTQFLFTVTFLFILSFCSRWRNNVFENLIIRYEHFRQHEVISAINARRYLRGQDSATGFPARLGLG
jgi:hypothetical protein